MVVACGQFGGFPYAVAPHKKKSYIVACSEAKLSAKPIH